MDASSFFYSLTLQYCSGIYLNVLSQAMLLIIHYIVCFFQINFIL